MSSFVRSSFAVAVLVLVCVVSTPIGAQQPEPADFVLQGGKVVTLDVNDAVAQAVAIRGGKIVFVGSDAEAGKFIGPKTEVYKAAGRTVVPGLNETHVHPTGAAQGEAFAAVHAAPFDR